MSEQSPPQNAIVRTPMICKAAFFAGPTSLWMFSTGLLKSLANASLQRVRPTRQTRYCTLSSSRLTNWTRAAHRADMGPTKSR